MNIFIFSHLFGVLLHLLSGISDQKVCLMTEWCVILKGFPVSYTTFANHYETKDRKIEV